MNVSRQNIAHYLVERNLIPFEELLDDAVRVYDGSSRHHNFVVERANNHHYFVKQSRPDSPDKMQTLQREAMFYVLVSSDEGFAPIRPLMPACHLFDTTRNIVVMEGLRNIESLQERRLRLGRYPEAFGKSIGEGLGIIHGKTTRALEKLAGHHLFAGGMPGILTYATVDPATARNEADRGVIHTLLNENMVLNRGLAAIRKDWVASALMHGDLKGPNILFTHVDDDEEAAKSIRFIDWELVGLGDPCWDVGAIFQDALQTMLAAGGMYAPQSSVMENVAPPMQSFWEHYCRPLALTGSGATAVAIKSIRHAAGRLIQTAYENYIHDQHLTPYATSCIQLAESIFIAPEKALHSYFRLIG